MSDRRLYGYADVGRFGLGHSLLAWARCEVWCRANGAEMLAPRWARLRIGPYLRRERDRRNYFRYFTSDPYVTGPTRLAVLASYKRIADPDASESARNGRVLYVFRNSVAGNFERHFRNVFHHPALLRASLQRMTRAQFHPQDVAERAIAVHVRMGDFKPFDATAALRGAHNMQLPLDWYINSLSAIRAELGEMHPAVVYSDGSDDSLSSLLSMPNVSRAPDAPAVTHMLSMAYASAIIGGGSNFSLWPAFLGQVPRLTYPGQSIVPIHCDQRRSVEYSGSGMLPTQFVDQVRVN